MGGSAWYKDKKILAGIALVVIVAGALLFMGGNGNGNGGEAEVDEPRSGEVAVTGKLGCTPLRSGATPTAAECVLGLQGDDGKFYALDTSKVESTDTGIEPDSEIRIVGTYAPANTSSQEASVFRYDGVLTVRVLSVND